ncbi:MAG: ATP-dependent DNA helicase UvrD2, partial [Acidimicrobiales bacterium]
AIAVPPLMAPPPVRAAGWRPSSWERLAGPRALGRSVLVAPGSAAPPPWAECERVVIDAEALAGPDLLGRVRAAYLGRTAVVYEIDPSLELIEPSLPSVDVHTLTPDFEFADEAAWRLLTANAVDARDPEAPLWPWTERAVAAGAVAATDEHPIHVDVVLPDDRAAVVDGGPFLVADRRPDDALLPVIVPRLALERGTLAPVHADTPTADLAPDQLEAVCEPTGTARIIAPAGSGKTRVLTERVRHLHRVGVPLDAMVMVAFNKRAQEEMTERTRDLPGLQIQTLNALALGIINGRNGFRDRGARVTTINEIDVRREIGELVSMPRRANTDPTAAWLDALSMVRLGLRDPTEVEAEFGGDVEGFAEFFPAYRRSLRRRDLVDFDEQIYLAIEVLLAEPDTRRHAQQVTRLLLIDEFQDLTPAHLLLIRLLAGPELEVFGVGDDDQTIYGYSGASPDWLIDFGRYFPGASEHALEINYRCPAPVVTAASNLLSHNQRRVPKQILSGPANRTEPTSLATAAVDDPTAETVERVRHLIGSGAAPADIVVLTRVNTLLAPVQVALHTEGIGFANRDGARFLDRTGVRAALSWLQIAAHPKSFSPSDIQQAARRPTRSLSPRVIEWMGEQTSIAGIERLAARLKGKDADKVMGFAIDAQKLIRRAEHGTTAQLLEFIRSEMGLDQTMRTLDSAHRGRNSAAHTDDLRALVSLGRLHPQVAGFPTWLRQALDQPEDPEGVVLSTVHRVKGLEWPHVIVHDASQGLFPHRLSTDVEEERRVFHVAITRGQTSVAVVAEAEAPSMFIAELDTVAPPRPATPPAAEVISLDAARRARSTGPAEVAAAVGLELEWGGYAGTVTEVSTDSVTIKVGRSTMSVALGSTVDVGGRRARLGPPGKGASAKGPRIGSAEQPSANPALFDALKAWRSARSKADGMPAYVVAKDATLESIAQLAPTTLQDLLTVDGIGPAKLDRYGDEILAVVDEHTSSSS